MSADCSSGVGQSLAHEIIEETRNEGAVCVTIVADAINCSSQVLVERAEGAEADDSGNFFKLNSDHLVTFLNPQENYILKCVS